MRICGIEDCSKKTSARGLCNSHYQMWYKGYNIPTFKLVVPHGRQQPDIRIKRPSDFGLGWLVGLLEGEGHFSYSGTQQLVLGMTDEDIVLKYKAFIEDILQTDKPLHLIVTHTGRSADLTMFTIRLYGANARAIMRLVVPYMGQRRRAKIWQTINGFAGRKLDVKSILACVANG